MAQQNFAKTRQEIFGGESISISIEMNQQRYLLSQDKNLYGVENPYKDLINFKITYYIPYAINTN